MKMNNDNYTPEKWTKKRYEQCIRELEQYIITLQHQLQSYKDKEDKLREYIEHNDFSDWHIGKDKDQFRKNDLLQILNEGSD